MITLLDLNRLGITPIQQVITGAAGVNNQASETVRSDRDWWVIHCAFFHTDALNPHGSINLQATGGGVNMAIIHSRFRGGGAAIQNNQFFPVDRQFLVPGGTRIIASVEALAAGAAITLHFVYYEILRSLRLV